MIEVELINKGDNTKKVLSMPENWSELKIKTFQEVMQYNDKFKDKTELTDEEQLERSIYVLAIMLDTDDATIKMLTPNQFLTLVEKMKWVLETEPEKGLPGIITIEGKDFSFEQNLNQMAMGEWIDLDNILKRNPYENIHQVVACLIREVTSKKPKYPDWYIKAKKIEQEYTIEIVDYESDGRNIRADFFKEFMTMNIAYPVFFFFYRFGEELLTSSLAYLKASIPTS